jgi:hypothetical protein
VCFVAALLLGFSVTEDAIKAARDALAATGDARPAESEPPVA